MANKGFLGAQFSKFKQENTCTLMRTIVLWTLNGELSTSRQLFYQLMQGE